MTVTGNWPSLVRNLRLRALSCKGRPCQLQTCQLNMRDSRSFGNYEDGAGTPDHALLASERGAAGGPLPRAPGSGPHAGAATATPTISSAQCHPALLPLVEALICLLSITSIKYSLLASTARDRWLPFEGICFFTALREVLESS